MDAVLQVGSHENRLEAEDPLLRPAAHASFDVDLGLRERKA